MRQIVALAIAVILALACVAIAKKNGPAPWKRDGGVRDEDEYVRVPCPPGIPKWRVCEKRRRELRDGGQ
jgi:hypothetical protein